MNETEFIRNAREHIGRIIKSPEALADGAVEATLAAYFRTDQSYKSLLPMREKLDLIPDMPGFGSHLLRYEENIFYGMGKARRDLRVKPKGGKL